MSKLCGFAYSKKALAFLKSCPAKYRKQIVKKIEALATDPLPAHRKLILSGHEEDEQVWRIRSGDYRVLYAVRDVMIVILDIDHRKDVYR